MYGKLILKNVRKHLHDYLIYFLTLTLAVSLFYAFNSIASQQALLSLSTTRRMLANQLGIFITLLSNLIAGVLAFLIIYANRFLLKRRKKELGVYMTLGMEKGKISRIFVGETFLIGVLALAAGLGLGLILSQGLSMVALRLFAADLMRYRIVFSLSALWKTVLCFAIIFLLVMLCNVWTVSSVRLIDLLTAGRKNEGLKIQSKPVYAVIFAVSLACIAFAGVTFAHNGILPVYNGGFAWAVAALLIGTALLFYSLSAMVMMAVRANRNTYLHGLNAFLLRQLGSKIQSNFLSMTIVSILLTVTICIISTGISVALTMNSQAQAAAPYDMIIFATVERVGDTDLYQTVNGQGVPLDQYLETYIQFSGYSSDLTYRDLFAEKPVSLWGIDKDLPAVPVPVITLTDFNRVRKLQGKPPVTLAKGQFLLNCNYRGTEAIMLSFLLENGQVNLNGITLTAARDTLLRETILMTSVDNNDRGTLIVPDEAVASLEKDYNILGGMYRETTQPDEVLKSLIPLTVDIHSGYRYTTKSMMYDMYYGVQAFVSFLCCYIGLVFLLICAAILALQQLTEMTDHVARYGLLQKLGVDDVLMKRTLFRQIGIYFFAPLLVAAVYSVFGIRQVMGLLREFLSMQVATNMVFTVALFLLIYGGYFLATALSCKRMIEE